jgi:hypothetical protein
MSTELIEVIGNFGLALSAVTVLSAIIVFILDKGPENAKEKKKRKKLEARHSNTAH